MRTFAYIVFGVVICGCASVERPQNTTAVESPPRGIESPPARGTGMEAWAYFTPGGGHLVVVGATSRTLCEVAREKAVETQPHSKHSPCVPVRITAE